MVTGFYLWEPDLRFWDATEARVLAQLQLEDLKWAEFVGQDRVVTLDDRATEGKGVVQMWNLLNGRLIGDIFEGRRTDYLIDVHDPFVQVQSGDDTLLWNGRFERPFVALLGSVFAISPDHRAILARLQSQWVLVKTFPEPQEAIEHVKINTPRCLTRRQRRDFFLDPDPPRWCITGAHHENDRGVVTWEGKWPYQGQEWIEWLSAKDRGERPPMPKSVD
jgi:hypothetical protein